MKVLSSYLGLSESPEADLANVVDFQIVGSCGWLPSKTSFQDWQLSVDNYPKCFWLSGEPATRKSTLSGHVVKYLEESNRHCSYFFFKHDGAGKSTCGRAFVLAHMVNGVDQCRTVKGTSRALHCPKVFAVYSMKHFSQHVARSTSSTEEQFLGLNKRFPSNALIMDRNDRNEPRPRVPHADCEASQDLS